MTELVFDRHSIDEVVRFVMRETKKGTAKSKILVTLEVLVDDQAQHDIEESLKGPSRIFLSGAEAAKYLHSL